MLAPAPLLHWAARRTVVVPSLLDGFAVTAVCGLVLLELLPQAVEHVGWGALALTILGFSLPMLLERHGGGLGRHSHTWITVMGLMGLVLHSLVDGMALVFHDPSEAAHGHSVGATAVLLHRVPVGLAVWTLIAPRYGAKAAITVLGIDALSTISGAALAHTVQPLLESTTYMVFQAAMAGALLHILLHTHGPARPYTRAARWSEVAGGVAGIAVLAALHHEEDHGHGGLEAWASRFMDLALESAPALLLGFTAAGFLTFGLPNVSRQWIRRGGITGQAMKGMLFGLPIPICSCGVVPLYQGLVRTGVPPAAAMAFLVATPELGLESVLLSLPLLGTDLTIARLAAAAAVALGVGIVIGGRLPSLPETSDGSQDDTRPRASGERLRSALRYGFVELVDDTAVWIVAGLAIAALFDPGALASWMVGWPPFFDVLLMAAIGLPIYVCASGATPIAAAMILAGISPGAAIAFLLAGPATNVTTFGVLSQLHGRRIASMFAASVFIMAVTCGALINLLLPNPRGGLLMAEAHVHDSWFYLASFGAIAAIFVAALVRRGIRGFLSPLVELGAHVHGEHCDHDHGHSHCDHPGCDQGHAHHHHPGCDMPGCGATDEPVAPRPGSLLAAPRAGGASAAGGQGVRVIGFVAGPTNAAPMRISGVVPAPGSTAPNPTGSGSPDSNA